MWWRRGDARIIHFLLEALNGAGDADGQSFPVESLEVRPAHLSLLGGGPHEDHRSGVTRTYGSVEEMPAEIRKIYEQVARERTK